MLMRLGSVVRVGNTCIGKCIQNDLCSWFGNSKSHIFNWIGFQVYLSDLGEMFKYERIHSVSQEKRKFVSLFLTPDVSFQK